MKKSKIMFGFITSLIAVFCFSSSAMADDNVVDADYAYEWLIDIGYSPNTLKAKSDESLLRLYNDCLEAESNNITTTTQTFDIEPTEGIVPFGIIPSNEITLTIETNEMVMQGRIYSVIVSASWEWKNGKPFNRFTDGFLINWDRTDFTYDSFFGDWVVDGVAYGTSTADEVALGGAGYYFDMGSPFDSHEPYGSCDLYLDPKYTMYEGRSNTTQFNCFYGHKRLAITGTSVSISQTPSLGLEFSLVDDTRSVATNMYYSK